MDLLFIEAAERVIEYVDDRYGRLTAWFTGAAMLVAPLAFVLIAAWWLFLAN